MTKVDPNNLEINQTVYYVASHLEPIIKNAEKGTVSTIKDGKVWVRFRGPQGDLTSVDSLYI